MRYFVMLLILLGLPLSSGCDKDDLDVVLDAVTMYGYSNGSYIYYSYDYDDDESWWEANDQHFDWMLWPF